MNQPIAVYLDPIDHDAIERELDEQMGITPKPKRERSWDCLAGDVELPCGHVRIARTELGGDLAEVVCVCGHSWREVA